MIKTFFSGEKIKTDQFSIFLAGPSPRSSEVKSWRPQALEILESLNYNGYVYNPEMEVFKEDIVYEDQIKWEHKGLYQADKIVFWIPRDLDTLPGLTTNVEFGYYIAKYPNRVIYGRPDDSPKNRYLDHLYKKELNKKPINNLEKLLKLSIKDD